MRLALVGATGLVGETMLKVLGEMNIHIDELIPVATEKNVGKSFYFNNKEYKIVDIETAIDLKPDVALFSAGKEVSIAYAPKFVKNGTYVIDNSSAWRMDAGIPLVVPEINPETIKNQPQIVANPNCSTIQLVLVLDVLKKHYGLDRVVVSTYQSVTGSGVKGINQLFGERENKTLDSRAYPYPIDLNVIPQIDDFESNGYTKEEIKIINESRKILNLPDLKITSTAVRIPTLGGHSESVNITLSNKPDLYNIKDLLSQAKGIQLKDNPKELQYPMPIDAKDNNLVWVGRIREDFSKENSINLWIVSDNLRKGAATNAVQILQYLVDKKFI
jgi:aspartate-semialdehyde dehydrogenase